MIILKSYLILQYMLDIEGVTGLIRTAFRQLNVDPSHYGIQVKIQNTNHQVIHYLCNLKLFE